MHPHRPLAVSATALSRAGQQAIAAAVLERLDDRG